MRSVAIVVALAVVAASCGGAASPSDPPIVAPTAGRSAPVTAGGSAAPSVVTVPIRPAFLTIPLTDVRTGERFTLGGFDGKVTVVVAMAVW